VDSDLDSDSESEMDSETDSKTDGLTRTVAENTSPADDGEYHDIKCESCIQYFACFQQLDTHYFDFHTPFVQIPLMTSAGKEQWMSQHRQTIHFYIQQASLW
jgi:hypothetical protein